MKLNLNTRISLILILALFLISFFCISASAACSHEITYKTTNSEGFEAHDLGNGYHEYSYLLVSYSHICNDCGALVWTESVNETVSETEEHFWDNNNITANNRFRCMTCDAESPFVLPCYHASWGESEDGSYYCQECSTIIWPDGTITGDDANNSTYYDYSYEYAGEVACTHDYTYPLTMGDAHTEYTWSGSGSSHYTTIYNVFKDCDYCPNCSMVLPFDSMDNNFLTLDSTMVALNRYLEDCYLVHNEGGEHCYNCYHYTNE